MSRDAWPQPTGGFEWTQEPWGGALRCAPLARVACHLFTAGNLRLVDDEREWAAVASRLGVPPGQVRLVRQVHGIDVAVVRAGSDGGWDPPRADILISDDPGVMLGVRVADCAPVLLADRRLGVVGAVHAGWRGTLGGASTAAVRAMTRSFGSNPWDLVAAIGPCLGPCCGEVGPEIVEMFREAGFSTRELGAWFSPGPPGRPYLNLWAANRDQLESAGVLGHEVHVAGLCTKCHMTVLHSYRAHGTGAGRMAGAIRAEGC